MLVHEIGMPVHRWNIVIGGESTVMAGTVPRAECTPVGHFRFPPAFPNDQP